MALAKSYAVLAGIILAAAAVPGTLQAPELNNDTYQKWRDYVLPKPHDLRYQAISWRSSFWDAVVEAQNKDKPILLWAMNGHPLACT